MAQQREFIDAVAYTKFRAAAAALGIHPVLLNDDKQMRALFVAGLRTASVEDILKKLAKATNQVCSLVADGAETHHLGTGFLIKTNRVLTAFHVLPEDDTRIVCRFNNITFDSRSVRSQEMVRIPVKNIERKSLKPEDGVVTAERLDFAVLELEADAGADPRGFVELGPRRIDVDKDAYVIGHPGSGSQVVFSAGKITQEFENATGLVFFHNASASHGESGAPVFNENFGVIGMHRAPGKEKNENEAVSTSVIHRVIDNP